MTAPAPISTPNLTWFHQARLGMFIHWGPYSVAARGEWVMNRERLPLVEYRDRYASAFTADRYDPRAWAKLARDAGMGYLVLTTRHHDGYCLWPTKTTDFHAGAIGPRRDLVREYVEAARAEGLRVGFYYSFADWHHPDYPSPFARDWPESWASPATHQRFLEHVQLQLKELFTHYGLIDILWWDGCFPAPADGGALNRVVRALQPEILINNRCGGPYDFYSSEQQIKPRRGFPWEACMTLNDNWGYHAGDHNWRSPSQLAEWLVTTAGDGGNLLLNVGPKPDGTLPDPSVRLLRQFGRWLSRNKDFLARSDSPGFAWFNWGRVTARDRTVFLHVFKSPGNELRFAELKTPVKAVRWLSSSAPIRFTEGPDYIVLHDLPEHLPDPVSSVIAIDLAGSLELRTPWTIGGIPD